MKETDTFGLTGQFKWIKSKDGVVIEESPWMKNKVVSSVGGGISIVLDRLASINTYSLNISHAEIGDSTTAVTEADTSLGNGLIRAVVSLTSRSAKTVTFRFFFPDATTPDNTYNEIGLFIDGTSVLNSGQLFNHLIMSPAMVKATGEDYTIICKITGSV